MTQAIAADASARFVPPTPVQLAAAHDIVGRFAACWARPSAEDLGELMQPDTRNLIPPMTEPADRAGVIAHFKQVLQQLPDLTVAVERWAPTGDAVLLEWRATATVAGAALEWTGVDRFCVRDDRMYEARVYWDTRGLADSVATLMARAAGQAH